MARPSHGAGPRAPLGASPRRPQACPGPPQAPPSRQPGAKQAGPEAPAPVASVLGVQPGAPRRFTSDSGDKGGQGAGSGAAKAGWWRGVLTWRRRPLTWHPLTWRPAWVLHPPWGRSAPPSTAPPCALETASSLPPPPLLSLPPPCLVLLVCTSSGTPTGPPAGPGPGDTSGVPAEGVP